MPVNPNHANFTPTLSGYSGQHPFRFWCQKVLPLVYDDSLSYYELLNKVVVYLNNVISDVAAVEGNVTELASAYEQLQNYVNTWFDNVDLQNETEIALDKMAENGELDTLIEPFVAERIDGVVANQIDGAVGGQIDDAVAGQIDNVVAEQINAPTVTAVTNWLNNNVDPVGSAVVVDSSLSISGAAADAKVTGDAIRNIQAVNHTTRTASGPIASIESQISGDTPIKLHTVLPYSASPYATSLRLIKYNGDVTVDKKQGGRGLNSSGEIIASSDNTLIGPIVPTDNDIKFHMWWHKNSTGGTITRAFAYDSNDIATNIWDENATSTNQIRSGSIPVGTKYVYASTGALGVSIRGSFRREQTIITLPNNFYGGEIDYINKTITLLYDENGNQLDTPIITTISGDVNVYTFKGETDYYLAVGTASYEPIGETTVVYKIYLESIDIQLQGLTEKVSTIENNFVYEYPLYYTIASSSAYINYDDGTATTNSATSRTDFIDVSGLDAIEYSRPILIASGKAGMAFYSEPNVASYIDGIRGVTEGGSYAYVNDVASIPNGAKYARFTMLNGIEGFYIKGIRREPLPLVGKKLSLLSDSVSAYVNTIPVGNTPYYTGSNDGVENPIQMWWNVLCSKTGLIPLVIDAWSGSSICYNYATDPTHSDTNKIPMSSDLRTGRLAHGGTNPDIIIISGGTNDWTYSKSTTTPLGDWDGKTAIERADVISGNSTFMETYANMISLLQTNYPNAIIVCLSLYHTNRGTSNGTVMLNDTNHPVSDYNNAIEQVCKIMGVPYIDIYNVGFNYNNYYPAYAEDSSTVPTHPNANGQRVIGEAVAEKLVPLVKAFES